MEDSIVGLFQGALDNLNYWWIILFMAIESSFIPFPSEVVMIPGAYMAAEDDNEMTYIGVIFFGTLGALLGALVNYGLSLWIGRPIVYKFANSRLGHFFLLSEEKVKKAEAYFEKRGNISTLIGRMIPAIRQLISIPAGLSRMNIKNFMIYTSLGACLWNSVLVLIGYLCHTQVSKEELIATVSHYSHIIAIVVIGLLVLALGYMIFQALRPVKKNNN